MIQGWHNEDYFILFEEPIEAVKMTERYAANTFLPGYTIIGLKGWDDFVLRDAAGQLYTAPTVPLTAKNLEQFNFDFAESDLRVDKRFVDKIKWYIHPILFGGDPLSEQNMAWITIDQHTEFVKWWNDKYRELQ